MGKEKLRLRASGSYGSTPFFYQYHHTEIENIFLLSKILILFYIVCIRHAEQQSPDLAGSRIPVFQDNTQDTGNQPLIPSIVPDFLKASAVTGLLRSDFLHFQRLEGFF